MSPTPYDDIAEWYDDWLGPDPVGDDPLFAEVDALMGQVAGQRVCDLACGQGRVARHLATSGARVVGVDVSVNMLAIARRHEGKVPLGVTYLLDDVARLESVDDRHFDGVVCHMALMDIRDLGGTLRTAARILRPSGWFVLSILHPCFNPAQSGERETDEGWVRTVSGYFHEGFWRSDARSGPPGRVGAHHRTLGTYVNALIDTGFVLERMIEPRLDGAHAERRPVWAEVPAVLIIRCRLAPAHSEASAPGGDEAR